MQQLAFTRSPALTTLPLSPLALPRVACGGAVGTFIGATLAPPDALAPDGGTAGIDDKVVGRSAVVWPRGQERPSHPPRASGSAIRVERRMNGASS